MDTLKDYDMDNPSCDSEGYTHMKTVRGLASVPSHLLLYMTSTQMLI